MRVKCDFGPYTLVRRHAEGGMSMVFVAQDHTLNREVAIKILSENFSADKKRVKAFREEAKVTASFSHPNVVRVLTTGEAFGRLYIAMEYVTGGHLEGHIKTRGRIPEIEMLPIAIDIARGLKAASARGRLHRDVKPGNIMLDANGQAKIVDFGLALATHAGKAHASEMWATPYYVSPEAVQAQPEDVRADIYSYGASLYHALAGFTPCGERAMPSGLLLEAKKKVIPLSLVMPSLSKGICDVVEKAMAFDPNDRYAGYDEIIHALEDTYARMKSKITGAVQISGVVAKEEAREQRRLLSALLFCLVFLSAATVGAYVWSKNEIPVRGLDESWVRRSPQLQQTPQVVPVLAKDYRSARSKLEARDFKGAALGFSQIAADASVPEPTRSWAGVEAMVAHYLEGQPRLALEEANRVQAHITAMPERPGLPNQVFIDILNKVMLPEPIPVKWLSVSNSDASSSMGWLIAGLKNWNQGASVEAVGYFSALATAKVPKDSEWVSWHQQIAKDYLADYKILSAAVFHDTPNNIAECRIAIQQLEEISRRLKTRGVAVANAQTRKQVLEQAMGRFSAQ